MKLRELLKRGRFVCGAIFFCLAYLPVFINSFFSPADILLFLSDSENTRHNVPVKKKDIRTQNNYFSSLSSKSLTEKGFLAFLNVISVPKNIKKVYAQPIIIENQKGNAKNSEVVFSKIANRVNVMGYAKSTVVKGRIRSNFYVDARNLGIPVAVIDSVIKNLSPKVNFKHSLAQGDKFEVIYSKNKELVYARITTKRASVAAYRFANRRAPAYYFESGEKCGYSSKNSGFGQPLAGRLSVSSFFGIRMHPVTGRICNHSGVDLRAVYGSPVYATQNGVVKRASAFSGYGQCVDIQHAGGYSSRYAHLSRYVVRRGDIVKKGQIIGHVGCSGTATGTHLHYELARYNRAVNPLTVKMVSASKPCVPNRSSFNFFKRHINNVVSRCK